MGRHYIRGDFYRPPIEANPDKETDNMRKARLKNDGEGFYHVTSRCVDRTFRFDDEDKTHIVEQIKRMGRFCGVEIGTYAVMSNHFHILLHVLPPQELADEELLGRVAALYGSVSVTQVSRGVCPPCSRSSCSYC